jgi:hypothetical protein
VIDIRVHTITVTQNLGGFDPLYCYPTQLIYAIPGDIMSLAIGPECAYTPVNPRASSLVTAGVEVWTSHYDSSYDPGANIFKVSLVALDELNGVYELDYCYPGIKNWGAAAPAAYTDENTRHTIFFNPVKWEHFRNGSAVRLRVQVRAVGTHTTGIGAGLNCNFLAVNAIEFGL